MDLNDVNLAVDFDMGYEQVEDHVSCESGSLASTGITESTAGTLAAVLEPRPVINRPALSLNAQLDFIMETTKKPSKAAKHERKCKRSRKTQEQLALLEEVLDGLRGGQSIGKKQVMELANRTGLTETKVYKWFWDRGYKLQ
eukprot:TRINITY_DN5544_c0_g1_i4.p3 TRINITY_DN5544_c0_g1~~TRINITY_DN5544_c0_g1_i4.p3  ORF type:complete len:142 (+),score=58.43 TRINITY_DN5544_c0_g1_i4:49-474(+)